MNIPGQGILNLITELGTTGHRGLAWGVWWYWAGF